MKAFFKDVRSGLFRGFIVIALCAVATWLVVAVVGPELFLGIFVIAAIVMGFLILCAILGSR